MKVKVTFLSLILNKQPHKLFFLKLCLNIRAVLVALLRTSQNSLSNFNETKFYLFTYNSMFTLRWIGKDKWITKRFCGCYWYIDCSILYC